MILIKDKDDTPQAFPLLRLAKLVGKAVGCGDTDTWSVVRARGYGTDVCALEDRLRALPVVALTARAMMTLMADSTQWFYDLECQVVPGVRFGLIDSGALFLDAPEAIMDAIGAQFSAVTRR